MHVGSHLQECICSADTHEMAAWKTWLERHLRQHAINRAVDMKKSS